LGVHIPGPWGQGKVIAGGPRQEGGGGKIRGELDRETGPSQKVAQKSTYKTHGDEREGENMQLKNVMGDCKETEKKNAWGQKGENKRGKGTRLS